MLVIFVTWKLQPCLHFLVWNGLLFWGPFLLSLWLLCWKKEKKNCSIAVYCLQILLLLKCSCLWRRVIALCLNNLQNALRLKGLGNWRILLLASILVEQPPDQPIWGAVFAFLFGTACVYIHNVCGYNDITHAIALCVAKQRGLLLWVHTCSCKARPARMVLPDCTWCPRSWNVFLHA